MLEKAIANQSVTKIEKKIFTNFGSEVGKNRVKATTLLATGRRHWKMGVSFEKIDSR